jgi:hypothetical protein
LSQLTILFFGDVVGHPGRNGVAHAIPLLKERYDPDFIAANGENAAGGSGITLAVAQKLFSAGVHAITTGDHFYRNKEYVGVLGEPRVLRPANFPKLAEGRGWGVYQARGEVPVAVVNLMGRIFMEPHECPFAAADAILSELAGQARVILVDMHAETTSEKVALGWHLDGRVSAVLGTHTHVQTADERILPGGTAYITDLGMTGPYDSVIGRIKEAVLKKLRTGVPARFEVAKGDVRACGAVLRVDAETGKALAIERFVVPLAVSGDEPPKPAHGGEEGSAAGQAGGRVRE